MGTLVALSMTPAARNWLATTTAARVLNVFEHTCNLINQRNDIVSLVTSERALTPFALAIGTAGLAPFAGLEEGSPVSVDGAGLTVGYLAIQTGLAHGWDPTPDWPALQALLRRHPDRLAPLTRIALELRPPESLLELFVSAQGDLPAMTRSVLERVQLGVTHLRSGLRRQSAAECHLAARTLAGVGGGLTPAGDDFLVGVMLAIWCGLWGEGRERLAAEMAEIAAPQTAPLSAAYLLAGARGECTAYWHRLFAALQVADTEVVRMATKSLMSIGHTSGADGLAGFLLAHIAGGL